jgi:predicted CXXCH cytochrome family protein
VTLKVAHWAPLLVLAVSLVSAQEVNNALGRGTPARTRTIFDEIQDAQERAAFREVWDEHAPAAQKQLALKFVEQYPRSVLLKEAYELAARAFVATGDYAGGLYWAQRSLRLMPENPFLLVMVADVAAKRSQPDLAEASARDALRYLSDADTPDPISPSDWPRVRNELRATANLALAQVAASRRRYKEAEPLLATALSQNPDKIDAVYVLGVVRAALGEEDEAASAFAHVMKTDGALADAARRSLRAIFDRTARLRDRTFDEYVASLQWTAPAIERAPAPTNRTPEPYAGSAACRDCHQREYDSWQTTGMAKMFRPYRPGDVIGDFSGSQPVSDLARAITDAGKPFVEIRRGEKGDWVRYPVDYVIGSKWQQAYATTLPDPRILVFPIQYSRVRSTWLNYWKIVDGPDSARTDISRFHEVPVNAIYQNTCAPCHTSQLKFQAGIESPGDASFREGGINCEMCHGPSSAHVEWMKGSRTRRLADDTPLQFRRLTAEQSVAVCAQCHSQSAVHDTQPGGSANYSADPENAAPFYRVYAKHLASDFSRAAFYRDGRYRATTFIVEAFTRSRCFRKGEATCASCHDPHPIDTADNPTSLKFAKDSDQMCVQCHATLRDHPERHTRHVAGTEASRCVSCHMPRIQDALLFQARSHEIDDIPDAAMTARFGQSDSPNACLACHRDRTVAWLQTEMAKRPSPATQTVPSKR